MSKSIRIGKISQKQGLDAESFVMNKLKKNGWTVIPTKGSKSPIDIMAHHKRKNFWWGIQVKSSRKNNTYPIKELMQICYQLYLDSVFAFVKVGKKRSVTFCKWKNGTLYHVYEDGVGDHVVGESITHECIAFEPKIKPLS